MSEPVASPPAGGQSLTVKRRRVALAAVLLSLFLRLWASWQLPVDADEPVYVQAGFEYARLLRAGDLRGVIDYPGNPEHPPLVKLIYGGIVLLLGDRADWERVLLLSRMTSAVFGSLAVWLAALIDPLAGLMLAVQTLVVKYTSQAYLEALPLLASLAAALALLRSRGSGDRRLWISAAALGLTLAGKLSYFPILFVLGWIFLREKRLPWKLLPFYLLAAGLVFWALDPALWRDPIQRALGILQFHAGYSQSAHVHQVGYPWYQPFIWVGRSMPYQWHPDVFFYLGFDGLIALLAVYGIRVCWRERRWVVVWIVAGMFFLLAWPVKWPQYALTVLPAVCFSAAAGARDLLRRVREWDLYWNWVQEMIPRPSKPLLFMTVLVLLSLTVGDMVRILREQWYDRGWTALNEENSPLPGSSVFGMVMLAEDRVALAGSGGLSLAVLPADTRLPADWQVFSPQNSPLPASPALALTAGEDGSLWLGTARGVARQKSGEWQVFGVDSGLAGDEVVDLEAGETGTLWAGGAGGLSFFDGQAWQAFTPANSPLPADYVLALTVDRSPSEGEIVWAATQHGLARLDTFTGAWQIYPPERFSRGSAGISDLLVDSRGRLWAATLGSGIAVLDGEQWTSYQVGNSGLPSNDVRKISEIRPGIFWIGTTDPSEAGGSLVRFDGRTWREYTRDNSGFNGSEPLAFAEDSFGRLWIGTRSEGLLIFEER